MKLQINTVLISTVLLLSGCKSLDSAQQLIDKATDIVNRTSAMADRTTEMAESTATMLDSTTDMVSSTLDSANSTLGLANSSGAAGVSVAQMCQEAVKNPIRASSEYKNKMVATAGVVRSIDTAVAGYNDESREYVAKIDIGNNVSLLSYFSEDGAKQLNLQEQVKASGTVDQISIDKNNNNTVCTVFLENTQVTRI